MRGFSAPRRATLGDGWALVVFSVPETQRAKRHELRTRLAHLGFGTVAPGVWLAPGTLACVAKETLARRELAGYVDIFRADHLGYADLADRVRQWWDLDGLSAKYTQFIERYQPLARRIAAHGVPAGHLFAELNGHLHEPALRHAVSVIHA